MQCLRSVYEKKGMGIRSKYIFFERIYKICVIFNYFIFRWEIMSTILIYEMTISVLVILLILIMAIQLLRNFTE